MLHWLNRFLAPKDPFQIPASAKGRLPECEIRSLLDSDIAACEAIYRLNEAASFPAGYFPRFSDWLRNRRSLILVAESKGMVCGLGGVNGQEQGRRHLAALSFGMVHPSQQRKGFGTSLLLARLALLRPPNGVCTAMLTTTGGSESFYRRFGFAHFHTTTTANSRREDQYRVMLTPIDREHCLACLGSGRLAPSLQGMPIPLFASLVPMLAIEIASA